MAEEIILNITANTSNAGKSVKSVEQDVKNLKKSVDETKQSVKDFSNEPWNDPNIAPFLTKLNELNKKVEGGTMTMRQYTQTIREYQTIALQAGETSPIGVEATRRAAELTDQIGDLRNATRNLADDHKALSGVIGITQGVVAGYGAWEGATALLGDENEDLQKTMAKLMAVQATLNGVMEIRQMLEKESSAMLTVTAVKKKILIALETAHAFATGATTTAMKVLRIAMMAIPIFAIIGGIMLIVEAVKALSAETEDLEESNNKLNDSFDRARVAMDRFNKSALQSIDNQIELAKATGASIEEISRLESKRLDQEEKNRKKSLKLTAQEIEGKIKIHNEAVKQGDNDRRKEILKEIEDSANKYKDLKALDGQYAHDKKILEIETNNEIAERNKRANEDSQNRRKQANENAKRLAEEQKREEERLAQEALDTRRLLEDLINENIEDSQLRRMTILQTQHQRELEELTAKYGEESEIVKQATIRQFTEQDALLAEFRANQDALDQAQKDKELQLEEQKRQDNIARLQGELIAMREDFDAQMEVKQELAEAEMLAELANTDLLEGEKFRIRQEYEQKLEEIELERAERTKAINKGITDGMVSAYNLGTNAIQSISDAFYSYKLNSVEKGSAKELAIQKKQFETNKKLQIAQAIMQGIQSVQAAYSSGSAIPIVGAVTGPLFAALAGVASVANIAKIKNTKFEGGSDTISTPSVPTPTIPTPESLQNEGTLTAGLPQGGQPTPQPTIVIVDSDIKASQDNLNQVEVISKVG